jgi:hypothetical protein
MATYTVFARYAPERTGQEQQYRTIEGKNRADILKKAKKANPDPSNLGLFIWATVNGPLIWLGDWRPEADRYIPR